MANLNEALFLLVVGMLTVFVILLLVVAVGNFIIGVTNRFLPTPRIPKKNDTEGDKGIHPKKMAAIVAAVDVVTKGKGRIINIGKTKSTK
ncbi:OadG family protein [Anaerorudis cellulosivorans]|uniref:OadG family protein n=1 Tax=Anaerorudis cellulosivorans TaxID=3397862 RepID=UPI00221F0668|nr:OadG family protein [Seramator thermalis]MCW1735930.1 OadG family protein [Seramator thermalis]